ncbi:MAG: nicotinate phosphoribosyltransferase, partial [Candidatus Lokiarchaeota archaeon]|nr:nicotinate phosphoribosyltransferase [Candidatus Lokiarchaeota archaeon]
YDTEHAAKKISKFKNSIKGVRIDSGDLVDHAKKVRKILDENGCEKVLIIASSDLNEYKIKEILEENAPIDVFGVGTELTTSRDDPTIAGVYKLIEYNRKPKIKISEEKLSYPGKKQIYRIYNKQGEFEEDILMLDNEPAPPNSDVLLIPVMKEGVLITELPDLNSIQQFNIENIEKLPTKFKELEENHIFKVRISKKLSELTNTLTDKFT